MRRAFVLALCWAVCCALWAWANGEVVTRSTDPRTGMFFPMRKTPAQVKHQHLHIRFVQGEWVDFLEENDPSRRAEWAVQRADIETTYTLWNPLERPETLDIAFAIPGGVTFARPPVLLDDKLIEWQYLDEEALWRMYLPAMLKSFEQALQEDEQLRTHLERAYQLHQRSTSDADRYLQKHAPQLVKGYLDSPVKIYAAFREKKPVRASHLARLLENIGRTEALPWARWDAQKRFLHPMTGKLIHPAEMFPYPSHSNATEGIVSLLLFRVTLQPGTTHRLTVRYSQEPGYIRPEEPGLEPVFRGVHLTYLLRTQSWASYGPIDVEVKIPKRLRLRSSPAVRFVAEQGGERIYRTRLVNPKGNLYITVANPDSFYVVSWQAVNRRGQTVLYDFEVRDPGDATSEHARFISGAVYLPVHILSRCTKIFYAYPPRKRNAEQIEYPHYIQVQWQAGRVLLEAGGRRVELRAGRPTAIVQGRPVRLTKPPVLLEGRTWLHIRDYFACALYLLDTPPNGKRHQLSQNQIRTHFDYRNMKVTVILPF